MSQLVSLLRKDARIVYRDGFLLFLPLYAFILALACRFGVPWIPVSNLDLYLAPAMVLFGTVLLGTLVGFALIEEREQGTWLLLRVLPLKRLALLMYLGGITSLFSAIVSLVVVFLYGYPIADPWTFALMLVVSSLAAPLMTLTLGALASNKIEGVAVSKIVSSTSMVAALVFVLPMPWQVVAAWCPWYWIYIGLLKSYAGDPTLLTGLYWPGYPTWLLVLMPLLLTGGMTLYLGRLYVRRAG